MSMPRSVGLTTRGWYYPALFGLTVYFQVISTTTNLGIVSVLFACVRACAEFLSCVCDSCVRGKDIKT